MLLKKLFLIVFADKYYEFDIIFLLCENLKILPMHELFFLVNISVRQLDKKEAFMKYQNFWPFDDIYFGTGVRNIVDSVSLVTNDRDYLFINLNRHTLLSTIKFISKSNNTSKIVIISSSRLMPLALYWLEEYRNTIAVFDNSTAVKDIIIKITHYRIGEKIVDIKTGHIFKMNHKDIMKIEYFLKDNGINELQKRFMNSPATVYRWRKELSKKLGVREPKYLLLPEKKNQDNIC